MACGLLFGLAGQGGERLRGPGEAIALEPPPPRSGDVPFRIWAEYREADAMRVDRPREALELVLDLFERVNAQSHPRGKCLLGLEVAHEMTRAFARHNDARKVLEEVREVADEAGFATGRGHARVKLAELAFSTGQLREAQRLLDEVLELEGIGGDVRASATVWKGRVLFERGDPQAMEVLEQGQELAREAGELESLVRYIITLTRHLERQNHSHERILRIFDIGRRLIPERRLPLENRMRGELWLAQSSYLWRRFERAEANNALEKAHEWFGRTRSYADRLRIWLTQAEQLLEAGRYDLARRRCGDARDYVERNELEAPGLEARIALLQADAARGQGAFDESEAYIAEAREFLGEEGAPRLRARLLRIEARLLRSRTQVQAAIEGLRRAATIYREIGDLDGELSVTHDIGGIYLQLGNEARARRTLQEALELARESGQSRQLIRVLTTVGGLTGDLEILEEAAERAEELGNYQQQGWAMLAAAERLHELGNLAAARRASDTAIECARDHQYVPLGVESRLERTRIMISKYEAATARGDEQEAAEHLQRAYDWGIEALEWARPTRDATLITQVNAMVGRTLRLRGQLEHALRFFAGSAHDLERARRSLASTETRATLYAQNRFVFSNIIDLATELERYDEALHWSESSKARAFLDMLAESEANVRTGIDPELLTEERTLLAELSSLQETRMSLMELGSDAENQLARLDREASELEQRFDELKERIRRESPSYHALRYPEPAGVEEIQAALGPQQMFLAFTLGEQHSHLFALTPDGLHWHTLPGEEEIARRVMYHRDLMISGSPLVLPELARHSAKLGQMLLGEVEALLDEYPEVVIAPDGILHYLPFEALALEEPPVAPETFADIPYLVLTLEEVIYVPSGTVFVQLEQAAASRESSSTSAEPFLFALGDPVFPGESGEVAGEAERQAGAERPEPGTALFPRLPFTKPEVEAIHDLASKHGKSELLLRERATEEALKTRISGARYVHLATHGVLDETAPSTSGLALADPKFGNGKEDGFLYLAEIFNLELEAELVVLSACQTGLGRIVTGEGVEGLTRAFLYAGAPRVVVSLWAVDDDSTARLMPGLYEQHWQEGLRPARALVEAKRTMIREQTHASPMFWAPFVATGAR